jgi:hypothetical protein
LIPQSFDVVSGVLVAPTYAPNPYRTHSNGKSDSHRRRKVLDRKRSHLSSVGVYPRVVKPVPVCEFLRLDLPPEETLLTLHDDSEVCLSRNMGALYQLSIEVNLDRCIGWPCNVRIQEGSGEDQPILCHLRGSDD